MLVHYAGVSCDMEAILELRRRHQLGGGRRILLIEDCAHAVLCRDSSGVALGTKGDMATFSFHHTKNVSCGEGGALCVGASQVDLWPRARVVWEKGTNRAEFLRGDIEKYVWIDRGSSFVMSALNAAMLLGQLERADAITQRRLEVWKEYHRLLEPLEARGRISRPIVPKGARHNAHMYYILLPEATDIDALCLQNEMHKAKIQAQTHYACLHSSPGGIRFGRTHGGDCPVSRSIVDRLLRLPLWPGMAEDDVHLVVSALRSALGETPSTLYATPVGG